MIKVEKAKNKDGFCASCLDNIPHKRLYCVKIETFGAVMTFHLCEKCAKQLLEGIKNPVDRPDGKEALREKIEEKIWRQTCNECPQTMNVKKRIDKELSKQLEQRSRWYD